MVETTMYDIMHPTHGSDGNSDFPHAPKDWEISDTMEAAKAEGLLLDNDHWEVVRALQEYYDRHQDGRMLVRELHDALDEKFHSKGGTKYLLELFPGGPIAQGCRLAGLEPLAGAMDKGFGSVM